MYEKKDIEEDLKPGYGDYIHAGVKAGLSFMPEIGGAISEFFSMVISPPLQKRRDEWIITIYQELQNLETAIDEFKIENLKDNEQFISVLLYATSIAMKTHQKEKLQALKNAVINSALFPSIDDSFQIIFLNLIDRYTPWHLKLLLKMDEYNPPEIHKIEVLVLGGSTAINPNIQTNLEILFFELHKQPDLAKKIVRDLETDGLIFDRLIPSEATYIENNYRRRTTPFGQDLLKFIRDEIET